MCIYNKDKKKKKKGTGLLSRGLRGSSPVGGRAFLNTAIFLPLF